MARELTREALQRAVDEPPYGLANACARARHDSLGRIGVPVMVVPVGTVELLLAAAEKLLAMRPATDSEIAALPICAPHRAGSREMAAREAYRAAERRLLPFPDEPAAPEKGAAP